MSIPRDLTENSIVSELMRLEKSARFLEPSDQQRRLWLDMAADKTKNFIGGLDNGSAYKKFGSFKGLLQLKPESDSPVGMKEILDEWDKDLLGYGLNPASGGHLGYIPGGGIFAGVLGDYYAALFNQYAGIYYGGPGAVKIENEILRWLVRLMGYPEGSLGNLTSGGSIANLIALVTAREAKGLQPAEYDKACVYLTSQVHHCIHKALRIIGLGSAKLRTIPTDSHYRMDTQALLQQIDKDRNEKLIPFLLVGTAGTTDTGAIDPLDKMAEICENRGLWFHVDAAYGGFFILSQLHYPDGSPVRNAFKGIERSDSLAIDPHKGLFLSYGLGAVLIKDVKSQYAAHYYKAAYMQDALDSQEELSPCDLSPELTKHFRGLRLWVPLRLYGLKPFVDCLDEKILLCRYFYEEVRKMGFLVGPYPETSVCIYRYPSVREDPNQFNQKIVDFVLQDGRVFVSSTTLDGVYWIRLAILSFRTHLSTVNTYLEVLQSALKSLNA